MRGARLCSQRQFRRSFSPLCTCYPRPCFHEQAVFPSLAGGGRAGPGRLRRTNIRPDALRQQILTYPHSPGQYHTIGPLMNMPQFQEGFGCPEGSKMTRPASERAVIW